MVRAWVPVRGSRWRIADRVRGSRSRWRFAVAVAVADRGRGSRSRSAPAVALAFAFSLAVATAAPPPNVVLFFADDLGYGDLACQGHPTARTPHLDRLAREGIRFTSFYSSQPVCSASRASLMTGCYANRIGIHGALGPQAPIGIHDDETTIAECLKAKGYATAIFGKWHLGHHPQFLPVRHGFDEYLGLPYSNDMWPFHPEGKRDTFPPLPLIENDRVLDAEVTAEDQPKLTGLYASRAVQFIERNRERPFFLYVPFAMPHVPLFAGEAHRGKSGRGVHGDVIEEIDAAVGEVLATLAKHGLDDRTLVIFTSDNGPWLSYGNHAGSAGPLREGKGTVFEGGVRVPFLARWPSKIPAGAVCHEPAMTIDLLPTVARLAEAPLGPRPIDGLDIAPLLFGEAGAKSPHEAFYFYYERGELQALRSGRWKLHLPHVARTMSGQAPGRDGKPGLYKPLPVGLELYDLDEDPGEEWDLARSKPEEVLRLLKLVEKARSELGDALTRRAGRGVREAGRVRVEGK